MGMPQRLGRVSLCLLSVLSLGASTGAEAEGTKPEYLLSFRPEAACVCKDYQLPAFEPSGIVWSGPIGETRGFLYAVSDNGQVARRPVDSPDKPARWDCLYAWCQDPKHHAQEKAANDFESIAYVPAAGGRGPRLFVGVEGDRIKDGKGADQTPQIRELSLAGDGRFLGTWDLTELEIQRGKGVEAMTFVPAPGLPNSVGGYFVAASTGGQHSRVKVYDVGMSPSGSLKPVDGKDFGLQDSSRATSDFYYTPDGLLYVAYDDEGHALDSEKSGTEPTYVIKTDGSQGVVVYAWSPGDRQALPKRSFELPRSRGLEGVTMLQGELFVALDMSKGQNPGTLAQAPDEKRPTRDLTCETDADKEFCKEVREQVAEIPANLDTFDVYDTCATLTGCTAASSDRSTAYCGWCSSDRRAYAGNADGPFKGTCDNWIPPAERSAASCDCARATSCSDIKGTDCGWCRSLGTNGGAMLGTVQGPKFGSCDNWFWDSDDCGCADLTSSAAASDCSKISGNCGWCRSLGVRGQPMLGTEKGGPRWPSVCANWFWDSDDCSKCADLTQCSGIKGQSCGWCFSLGQNGGPNGEGQPMLNKDHKPVFSTCANYVWDHKKCP